MLLLLSFAAGLPRTRVLFFTLFPFSVALFLFPSSSYMWLLRCLARTGVCARDGTVHSERSRIDGNIFQQGVVGYLLNDTCTLGLLFRFPLCFVRLLSICAQLHILCLPTIYVIYIHMDTNVQVTTLRGQWREQLQREQLLRDNDMVVGTPPSSTNSNAVGEVRDFGSSLAIKAKTQAQVRVVWVAFFS